ncbi:hypothetical protein ACFQS6_15935 [Xanthomonas populi]
MIEGTGGIDEQEIRSACDALLKSEAFIKAPRMGRLLRYLVEQVIFGDTRNTNEYAIGIAVFDRDPAQYQPAEDPVVRVQVGRLRQRLNAYYCMQGAGAALAIKIPVGRYMPVIARQNAAASVTSSRLMIHPIHYIAERGEGKAFADGLYEELLDQLFQAFGEVFTVPLVSSVTQSERGASAELHARAGATFDRGQLTHRCPADSGIDPYCRFLAAQDHVGQTLRPLHCVRHPAAVRIGDVDLQCLEANLPG